MRYLPPSTVPVEVRRCRADLAAQLEAALERRDAVALEGPRRAVFSRAVPHEPGAAAEHRAEDGGERARRAPPATATAGPHTAQAPDGADDRPSRERRGVPAHVVDARLRALGDARLVGDRGVREAPDARQARELAQRARRRGAPRPPRLRARSSRPPPSARGGTSSARRRREGPWLPARSSISQVPTRVASRAFSAR